MNDRCRIQKLIQIDLECMMGINSHFKVCDFDVALGVHAKCGVDK